MTDSFDFEEFYKLLCQLVEAPSPSGYEENAQQIIYDITKEYADEIFYDDLHNLVVKQNGEFLDTIMIVAHIDEVGLIVKHIDSDGFLYFSNIGGIDFCQLPGTRVNVCHDGKNFGGVIGRKSFHHLDSAEKGCVKSDSLWIDTGLKSEMTIDIGDVVSFASSPFLINNMICTHSADNKVGVCILALLMRITYQNKKRPTLVFVFTVQEEIGYRGAFSITNSLRPDKAIVIDAALATDYPGIDLARIGQISLNGGLVISVSPDIDKSLRKDLIILCNENKIKYQLEIRGNGCNMETQTVQLAGNGTRVVSVSYPIRYMHSPSELVAIPDIRDCFQLLLNLLR